MLNFMFKFFGEDKAMIKALEIEKECFIEECRDLELASREQKKAIDVLKYQVAELIKLKTPVTATNFNVFDFEAMKAFSIEIIERDHGITVTSIGYINPDANAVKEWIFYWGEYHNKADHLRLVADFNLHMNKVSLAK